MSVAVETPRTSMLHDLDERLVMAIEQFVGNAARRPFVGQLQSLGAKPLYADHCDRLVEQNASDCGGRLEVSRWVMSFVGCTSISPEGAVSRRLAPTRGNAFDHPNKRNWITSTDYGNYRKEGGKLKAEIGLPQRNLRPRRIACIFQSLHERTQISGVDRVDHPIGVITEPNSCRVGWCLV